MDLENNYINNMKNKLSLQKIKWHGHKITLSPSPLVILTQSQVNLYCDRHLYLQTLEGAWSLKNERLKNEWLKNEWLKNERVKNEWALRHSHVTMVAVKRKQMEGKDSRLNGEKYDGRNQAYSTTLKLAIILARKD